MELKSHMALSWRNVGDAPMFVAVVFTMTTAGHQPREVSVDEQMKKTS